MESKEENRIESEEDTSTIAYKIKKVMPTDYKIEAKILIYSFIPVVNKFLSLNCPFLLV